MTALFVWLLLRDLAARRAQAAAVEQAVRMDALGRLTGGVAHDFNNRLMIIQGNADTLARRLADQEAAQRPLASIRLATNRGAKLVGQLLTFARGGPTEARIVDLNETIASLRLAMEQVASLSVRLRLHPSEQDVRVELDPLQLEAALINLCANARDAMPEGGEIAITVKPQGDQARVEVRDSGPGFAPEVAPRVFEPFFTTKPGGKGTGLGLTQVYGFMHAFGGSAVVTDAAAAWPRCSSPSRLRRSPRAMRALRQRQPSVRPGSSWWRTKKRSVRPRALTCGSPGWRWKRRGTPTKPCGCCGGSGLMRSFPTS